jgi:hypothetical protein
MGTDLPLKFENGSKANTDAAKRALREPAMRIVKRDFLMIP